MKVSKEDVKIAKLRWEYNNKVEAHTEIRKLLEEEIKVWEKDNTKLQFKIHKLKRRNKAIQRNYDEMLEADKEYKAIAKGIILWKNRFKLLIKKIYESIHKFRTSRS